jgi:hypothetical protein
MSKKFIKLTVTSQGDRSVGIWGNEATLIIERKLVNGDYGDSKDCRKFIKESVIKMFNELFDDTRVHACFNDECWNCGQLLTDCKCGEYE